MATLTINREWLWDALTTMTQIGATPRGGLGRRALPAVLSHMCYSPSQTEAGSAVVSAATK